MNIIIHEWKMNRKTLLIWSLSIGVFCFCFIWMYPSLQDTLAEMSEAYSNMGGFSQALGLDKLGMDTIMGFYSAEIGSIFCLGGGLFAAILGTEMLAKEEGGHTAEFLFTLPTTRNQVLIKKLVSMVIITLVFNVICLLCNTGGILLIGGDVEWKKFFLYHIAQMVMQMEIMGICFMISSFLKKVSMGLGIGVVIILYACNMLAKIIPDMENLKYITPYYYSDAAEIISTGKIEMDLMGIGFIIMMISIVIGLTNYNKKDLAT